MCAQLKLTEEQVASYQSNGYLVDLPPVYTPEEMVQMNADLKQLQQLLLPGENLTHTREWHMKSKWLYDIVANPRILDYVESLLGPNFYAWGSQFFAKKPHSPETVAWHQDAYYWALSPHHSVTVWLAFTDVDDENGAMRVIPGTHNKGIIKHRRKVGDSVLNLELEEGSFNESEARSLHLKAGQVSLHDDNIVHGSPANMSDRWRIGLTIRYSSTIVRADMERAPAFRAYMMRGVDEYRYNPYGEVPTEKFGRLPSDFYADDVNVKQPDQSEQ